MSVEVGRLDFSVRAPCDLQAHQGHSSVFANAPQSRDGYSGRAWTFFAHLALHTQVQRAGKFSAARSLQERTHRDRAYRIPLAWAEARPSVGATEGVSAEGVEGG